MKLIVPCSASPLPHAVTLPMPLPPRGEFTAVIADWELALWFVTPNGWLGGRLPLNCVSTRSMSDCTNGQAPEKQVLGEWLVPVSRSIAQRTKDMTLLS